MPKKPRQYDMFVKPARVRVWMDTVPIAVILSSLRKHANSNIPVATVEIEAGGY